MVSDPRFAPLTRYLRNWLAASSTAGLSISITDSRETLYTAHLGFADVAGRRPVQRGTTFQIGSIGKSMTALAVMRLAEAGRLDLDAPLSSHLPWFAIPSRYGPIAIKHVLNHTAGLPSGSDFTPAARYEGFALRESEAAWEPGARFHYSNTGYKVLGWLLEDLTGKSYGEVLRERILEPLGMTATVPVISHGSRNGMATGYVPLHDDRPRRRGDALIPATWMEYAAGDGSPAATAEDMARYARLWLNGGRIGTRAIVSPAGFDRMTTPSIRMDRGYAYKHDYGYGYGIITHHADGHHFIGHGGSTVGFGAIMLTDQTEGLGATILCNGSDVDTYQPARFAIDIASAVRAGRPAPVAPDIPDPTEIADATRYVGDYIRGDDGRRLSVRAAGRGLRISFAGGDCLLEHTAGNSFCAPVDQFDPFPLRFRSAGCDGHEPMAEIAHGADVYIREGATSPDTPVEHPAAWSAYVGHYRSHAPYMPNFRVVLRRGSLLLAWPRGAEEALTPRDPENMATGWFDVGLAGSPTAERVKFDTVVGSRALRAQWTGGGSFYRVD